MPTQASQTRITMLAAGDLSAQQFSPMYVSAAKTVDTAAAATAKMIGILQNKPAAAGRAAEVVTAGISKAKAGGNINPGDRLTATTGGKVIATVTSTNNVVGYALEGAVDGDVFTILVAPHSLAA